MLKLINAIKNYWKVCMSEPCQAFHNSFWDQHSFMLKACYANKVPLRVNKPFPIATTLLFTKIHSHTNVIVPYKIQMR